MFQVVHENYESRSWASGKCASSVAGIKFAFLLIFSLSFSSTVELTFCKFRSTRISSMTRAIWLSSWVSEQSCKFHHFYYLKMNHEWASLLRRWHFSTLMSAISIFLEKTEHVIELVKSFLILVVELSRHSKTHVLSATSAEQWTETHTHRNRFAIKCVRLIKNTMTSLVKWNSSVRWNLIALSLPDAQCSR